MEGSSPVSGSGVGEEEEEYDAVVLNVLRQVDSRMKVVFLSSPSAAAIAEA